MNSITKLAHKLMLVSCCVSVLYGGFTNAQSTFNHTSIDAQINPTQSYFTPSDVGQQDSFCMSANIFCDPNGRVGPWKWFHVFCSLLWSPV
ncbi:MAG: hypothetical protein F4039_09805 [Gammaproteobacteria bacterium]|nr:hypothetical protein [Gammaproteobacteria bacterium]MYK44365.1 hypothetical protein [Gammaproteobacteria bacterium]